VKKIFVLLVAFIATSAFSKDVLVRKQKKFYDDYDFRGSFQVNADLGRAWVYLEGWDNSGDPDWDNSFDEKVKIEGLFFDQESQNIMYKDAEVNTVCATTYTKTRRVFGRQYVTRFITPTGNCTFETKMSSELYDDGFNQFNVSYYNVFMVVK
jgi:hypothetical protein